MQIGRGPATVIGLIAVSQATLSSRSGWTVFARKTAGWAAPGLAGYFFDQTFLAGLSSGECSVSRSTNLHSI